MPFNSPAFVFGFVPLVLAGFFLCARLGRRLALAWLVAASLVFYAAQDMHALPVLLLSIGSNWWMARVIASRQEQRQFVAARVAFVLGLGANLLLLVYFKYAAFILGMLPLSPLDGPLAPPGPSASSLPLGISFFTFTQLAFLVDVFRQRVVDLDPLRYGLFVSYYPHLSAGPLLHHGQTMPQFQNPHVFRFDASRLADGAVLFILGLFKKLVFADQFAVYANPGFEAAAAGHALSFFEAWGAALSFALQIYFDFSGYSDMAIGLAWMMGIVLPLNFNAPYKASNIIEFWRRWHISLSSFLRDYLYVPLGGNRRGPVRRHINLMLTMLLGGLWHGAGWTFLAWGGLHGLCLTACHGWQALRQSAAWVGPPWLVLPARLLSTLVTFLVVVLAWVLFRSADLTTAGSVLQGMAGLHGALLPEQWLQALPALSAVAQGAGKVPYLGDGSVMGGLELGVMLLLGLTVVWGAPTLPQLRRRWRYALLIPCLAPALQRLLFDRPSPFLYFQF